MTGLDLVTQSDLATQLVLGKVFLSWEAPWVSHTQEVLAALRWDQDWLAWELAKVQSRKEGNVEARYLAWSGQLEH